MNPPLRARLTWQDRSEQGGRAELRAAMARTAFYLFATGATLGLASLALPGNTGRDQAASIAIGLVAYALAAVCLIAFERLPLATFQLLSAFGTLLISVQLLFGGRPAAVFALFYFWVILYAGYFFTPAQAAAQVLLVVLAYGTVLLWRRPEGLTVVAWLVTAGTLAVAAGLLAFLKSRLLTDSTKRKRLEEELRQAQKLEALGRLAGGAAHDFNNILLAVRSELWLLSETLGEEQSEERRIVDSIERATEQAARLTRQLLAFGRRQVFQPREVDLNGVVAAAAEMLRPLIGEDIDLRLELHPDLGLVYADPGQIEQVVVNLLVNARDAMPAGGTLTVETRNVDGDGAASNGKYARSGPYVQLTATDTGVGIAPEHRPLIFEPFFTTKERGEGTGLGLATVHGIVSQSDGRIEVDSEPGRGSSFSIYLPRTGERKGREKDQPLRPSSAPGSETVLFVEDDDLVRDPVRQILERWGYRVLAARDGGEALTLARKYEDPIHVLVTDVVMPGMSGPELARELLSARPKLKVLYISGYLNPSVRELAARMGGPLGPTGSLAAEADLLQKPFTPDELVRRVRRVLDLNGRSLSDFVPDPA